MKHQFKFNPLATAILTLLCGHAMSSHAETTEPASSITNQQLKQSIQDAYPGQSFFEQYYVDKTAPEAQQRFGQELSSAYCQGAWVTPISPDTVAVAAEEATSTVTADYGHYNPNGDSVLEGNVVIDQQGRQIRADKITIDQTQTYASAEGRVQMAQAGLLAQSDQINYNLKTQQGDLHNSFYIAEEQHAHGMAEKIARTSTNTLVLNNATYSTCPPEQAPTWKIQADEIKLNQETGRGETRGTKLYVKDVPVLAVPYFNFPIDDRRTTGILTPSFGFTNDGGVELAVPVYLNLAPNYDATVTPRYIGDRGPMLEGEFRYLTENFGQGQIWGGYLASDNKYNDEDRKDFHFLHNWQINEQFNTNLEYNYASDKDYFADLNNNPNSRTDLNLRRAWELNYRNGIPGLRAQLKVEDFQTLDPTIPDEDRPYARLPQFLLNYKTGNPQGFQIEFNHDTAYFKKDINNLEASTTDLNSYEPSGTRIYNDFKVRYNYRNPWSFVIPEVSLRNVNTFFDKDTQNALNQFDSSSETKSVTVPQFTLDAGLTFEKEGRFLQTITPRAFYAYAPYQKQDGHPNFDSATASINYDQLFSPYRFYGHDRLEDNNFLSLGLSYSLFDEVGLERIRASLGQSFFFEDRRVTLENTADSFDTESRTGPVVSLASQLTENLNIGANAAWMSNGDNAQRDLHLFYTGEQGNLYNVGYINRRHIPNRQDHYDQVVASFIQPVYNNWRILGHAQYDLDNSVAREYLLGVNYESCCWGISVYGRSYYNDLDDVSDHNVKPKRAIMAELNLKGLGSFNNKLASLLENRILGFNRTNQTWTQR
ncbi:MULTISPECIES: LPS-assembly protein LptD [Acinetobacter]|uniref:LPS-assembly protein LptD n=1 Tax=Acinetobacter TaxID=469 RepID=UPI000CEC488C|nr:MULTISPECIES: LPS-assembly protein LptD [Acinetobacter]MDM1285806.1 LPS-assembly protein LptD [Acinetobacter indicus]MDM1310532.1 LPS-assembly protein LptD [Acinetobacter indicus]MDM1330152.1 LPS-assembly protein LptD [Acinetobacter indicus]MDM1337407.1 LPS-assembly protein LptD [Acinetobacter indicus]MDM1770596.1 LPS-assembly protein LptD [Acinetobacter indicus]